jgi:hypothetical protein
MSQPTTVAVTILMRVPVVGKVVAGLDGVGVGVVGAGSVTAGCDAESPAVVWIVAVMT